MQADEKDERKNVSQLKKILHKTENVDWFELKTKLKSSMFLSWVFARIKLAHKCYRFSPTFIFSWDKYKTTGKKTVLLGGPRNKN